MSSHIEVYKKGDENPLKTEGLREEEKKEEFLCLSKWREIILSP